MIGFICVMHKCKDCGRSNFDTINNFIKSLYEFCKKDFILYLFDNGSDEKYNVPNYPNIKYEYIEDQNVSGLARPCNDGVKMAAKDKCDIVVFVNDDIIFNETINKFFDIIQNHKYKNVGLYGPLTNRCLGNLQKAEKAGKGIVETNKTLNGFLLAFTRQFYNRFKFADGKLFDPKYKWGGGEGALKRRIKPRGGKLFIIKDCWLYHHKIGGWRQLPGSFPGK